MKKELQKTVKSLTKKIIGKHTILTKVDRGNTIVLLDQVEYMVK